METQQKTPVTSDWSLNNRVTLMSETSCIWLQKLPLPVVYKTKQSLEDRAASQAGPGCSGKGHFLSFHRSLLF